MRVKPHPENGSFNLFSPDARGMSLVDGRAWVEFHNKKRIRTRLQLSDGHGAVQSQSFSDVHGSGTQFVIESLLLAGKVALTLKLNQYDQQPFCLIQLSIKNQFLDPIYLEQFCLCQVNPDGGGQFVLNSTLDQLKFFKVGWHGWAYTGLRKPKDHNSRRFSDMLTGFAYSNPSTPRPYRAGEFWSEGWGILAGADAAFVAGFVSTDRQFGQLNVSLRAPSPSLKLVTQLDGIQLDPGESLSSEWGFLQFVSLPNPDPANCFIQAVARQMRARVPGTPPPPMWTHWYHYYQSITEHLFVENLDLLAQKRPMLPFEVVELDDGYPSAWGDWENTNDKFPSGLSAIATQIKEKGITPGLWLAPFSVHPHSNIAREHSDWLVIDKNGKPLQAGFVYNSVVYVLDTSHPAALEHIRSLIERIVHQLGFTMLKIDFLYTAALAGMRYDPKLTRAQCLRQGLEAIRLGAGEDSFLLACGCPFGPAIGLVDAMRISPDTAPSWEPYFNWLPWISPLIRNETSAPSLRNALRHSLNLNILHRRWWWNDPDCILARETNSQLTEAEVQSALTLIGLSGGMLVSSDDLSTLSDERLHWLSLLVPNVGLHGESQGWLDQEMPQSYEVKIHARGGDFTLLGLFNWDDHPRQIHVDLSSIGFPQASELEVFDFWNNRFLSLNDMKLSIPAVPPHGCHLLRVCTTSNVPHILGDTLHISQGVEFSNFDYQEGILKIETIDFNRWVNGRLYLWLPSMPDSVSCNDEPLQIIHLGDHVYALTLRFLSRARIELVFG